MLNASSLPATVSLCYTEDRRRTVEALISEFRAIFPKIEYEIDTKTRIVNAQAFTLGGRRCVRLYGGLVLHPLANADALFFTLLHETGHHCARGQRFAGDPYLACDCLADKWALGPGAKMLRRHSGRVLNLATAFSSLDAIFTSIDVRVVVASRRRLQQPQACWAKFWETRKFWLNDSNTLEPTGPCYYYSK